MVLFSFSCIISSSSLNNLQHKYRKTYYKGEEQESNGDVDGETTDVDDVEADLILCQK